MRRERGWVEQPNLVWVFPGDCRVRTSGLTTPLSPLELGRMRLVTERLSGREVRVVMREER